MKHLVSALLLIALSATACVPAATSLWGEYATPTPINPMAVTPAQDLPTAIPTETAIPVFTQPILPTETFTPTPTSIVPTDPAQVTQPTVATDEPLLYYAQSGDTLEALAARFNVEKSEITSPKNLPETGLIDPDTLLIIPRRIEEPTTPNVRLLPDSELIYSVSSANFNSDQFIANAGGHLSQFRQWVNSTGWISGARAIQRAAEENSISPRILLALLEYKAHWVYGGNTTGEDYPMGFESLKYKGLFLQIVWTVNQLYEGYYGWRAGTLTELTFPNGETLRIHPELNAGTVALQYFFSRQYNRAEWEQILNPNSINSFVSLYTQMFGDPTLRAQSAEPVFPANIEATLPALVLPFEPNREWSLTGGPHGAWEHDGPLAAIDFAPSSEHGGCEETRTWVLAAAAGVVVRSGNGVVVVDLDNDGLEQTGWNLLYLHIAAKDRVPKDTRLNVNDRIGHASCEGGQATGTHLHFARKYNGEWVLADGPLPMMLSGWTVHEGAKPYEGTLTRGTRTVIADPVGQSWSIIIRKPDE